MLMYAIVYMHTILHLNMHIQCTLYSLNVGMKQLWAGYRFHHKHIGWHSPYEVCLTSLAVIPRVTRGRAKMQKTVTPRLTQSMDSKTDGHGGVIRVALRCEESVVN